MRQNLPMRLSNPFQLLDTFFSDNLPEVYPGHIAPATNIAETADEFEIAFEMPGLRDEDITLDVENRKLTVAAERPAEPKIEGKTWHRLEQRHGKWSRTIQLPTSANSEAIEATYQQGILRVKIGKHPKSKPTRIQIKAE